MTKTCPYCKAENDDNEQYCHNCGINLTSHKNVAKSNDFLSKLIFWPKDDGYRLAKSKLAFWIAFLLSVCSYENFYFNIYSKQVGFSISTAVLGGLIAGLLVGVPVFVFGFIVHKMMDG